MSQTKIPSRSCVGFADRAVLYSQRETRCDAEKQLYRDRFIRLGTEKVRKNEHQPLRRCVPCRVGLSLSDRNMRLSGCLVICTVLSSVAHVVSQLLCVDLSLHLSFAEKTRFCGQEYFANVEKVK